MEAIDILRVIVGIAVAVCVAVCVVEILLFPLKENIKRKQEKAHRDVTERILRDILMEVGEIKINMKDNEMVTSFILSNIKKKRDEEKND